MSTGEADVGLGTDAGGSVRIPIAALHEVDVLALPTLVASPPPLTGYARFPLTQLTAPFNLAGVPALSMPVPSPGPVPVSLQLVGPVNGEELLCATGLVFEQVSRRGVRSRRGGCP